MGGRILMETPKFECICKSMKDGKRCAKDTDKTILGNPVCGRHYAIFQKSKRLNLYPSGKIYRDYEGELTVTS
jgi:hypothetical protein